MSEVEQIVESYKKLAVDILKNPDNPEALSNQLTLLMARGKHSPAHLAIAKRVVDIAPDNFVAQWNYGSALMWAGHYHESLGVFQKVVTMAPESHMTDARGHVALSYYDMGDFEKCIAYYDETLRLGYGGPKTMQNRAMGILGTGDLAKGLWDFEVKYHRNHGKPIENCGIPRWKGEPLEGKKIIIHHEQGWGDAIQFSRFLPRIQAGHLAFAGPPELVALLQPSFTPDGWLGEEGPFDADYYTSLMGAAGALRTGYDAFTGDPYLAADVRNLPARGKLKVGLVWHGSSALMTVQRSCQLEDLCPLFELPGTAFYSLQVHDQGVKDITRLGLDGFIADLGPSLKDWYDTARAMMAMDVIVSIDTSSAHLAGALGKPTLLMLPYACCWRWFRNRDTSPWYKSAKLFRQKVPLDWRWPVAGVRQELEKML